MKNCGVACGDGMKSGRYAATLIIHSLFILHPAFPVILSTAKDPVNRSSLPLHTGSFVVFLRRMTGFHSYTLGTRLDTAHSSS